MGDDIEALAYAIAKSEADVINRYVKFYIKRKPKYMPDFVYRFILKRVLVLANFNKT